MPVASTTILGLACATVPAAEVVAGAAGAAAAAAAAAAAVAAAAEDVDHAAMEATHEGR